jgi:RNA polymerase sigma factor (sigma-70 family)
MLESKRQADERRKELVQRLKLANAVSVPRPSNIDQLPTQDADSILLPAVTSTPNIQVAGEGSNSSEPLRLLTVDQLIDSADISVRLNNCFINNREVFRQFTVRQVLLDRENFVSKLIKCPNLGRKTANEVLSLVDLYHDKPWPIGGHADPAQHEIEPVAESPTTEKLPQNVLDEPITAILTNLDTTTRLWNLVKSGAFDTITLGDFIADPAAIKQNFMAAKNSGRKTANEAIKVLSDYVELARENIEGHLDAFRRSDRDSLLSEDIENQSQSPRQRIQEIVERLPQKELQVLTERYGLDGNTPQTLQDIAHRVHVTRERVRQVESKAIRRLQKTQKSRSAFESLLNAERESAWAALCGDASSLNEARLYEASQLLDPYLLLAIDVLYIDIREWITTIAHSFPGGWFRNQSDANRLVDFEKAVRSVAEGYATPVTPEQFGEITGLIAGENLVYEGQNWAFFESYLCVGYLGAKAKRLVRMHRIAKAAFPNGMFDICQLAHFYRQQYPDDDCGSRIFQMQADDAPHLFAPLFDNISVCLPTKGTRSSFVSTPPFERGDFRDDDFAEGTIGNYLATILSTEGPQRQSDLKELVLAAAGDTNIAESSIGVVLISNPCFRRVAPGAFALYHGDIELRQNLQPRLLEERHCRAYCYARYGGAPADYYPAWGPSFEMALAEWAKAHATTDLYRSLLAVADPRQWPASNSTIALWLGLQKTEACWEIAIRRVPLGSRFIDAEQMFSVLMHLALFGWISWFAINRTTGSKNDNHDAADVLALLVLAGLARPEADWQIKHIATDLGIETFNRACEERHMCGKLSWENAGC